MTNINDKKKEFYKLVFTLVFPMALQNLINVGVSTADVIMLGKVGETALSASSLAGQLQFIMTIIFFGFTSGAAVLTAQYWGKKDIRTIEKVLAITMRYALLISIIFTLAALIVPELIMKLYSSEEAVIYEGAGYLRIIGLSYIISTITMIYLNIMRSVEKVIISTVVYSVSLVINIFCNSIFIFGLFGLEPMGVKGAALGTLIARICELIIVWFYATKINTEVQFHFKDLFIKEKLLTKDFFTYSIPVILNDMLWGAGTSANAAIIGHLGSSVVAANSVTQVTRQLAMVVTFGISNATAIIIGKAIGEQKEEMAKLYAKRFVRLTLMIGVIGSIIILGVSQIAQSQLSLSQDAQYYLKIMMFVMSYFYLCQAYNTTLVVGVFRAGGDTKFGLFVDSTTLWGCSILFGALAAFLWKLPIPIVYMIIMSDEVIKLPFTTIRYKSYKWVRNVTR